MIISATNLTTIKIEHFSYTNVPDMPILDAVLMSSAFPGLFAPIKYGDNYYTDGGCTNGFPLRSIFNDDINGTIGFYPVIQRVYKPNIESIEDYVERLFQCVTSGSLENALSVGEKYIHFVKISENTLNILTFDIATEIMEQIFKSTYDDTIEYLKNRDSQQKQT